MFYLLHLFNAPLYLSKARIQHRYRCQGALGQLNGKLTGQRVSLDAFQVQASKSVLVARVPVKDAAYGWLCWVYRAAAHG